jgi:hypothetical protein
MRRRALQRRGIKCQSTAGSIALVGEIYDGKPRPIGEDLRAQNVGHLLLVCLAVRDRQMRRSGPPHQPPTSRVPKPAVLAVIPVTLMVIAFGVCVVPAAAVPEAVAPAGAAWKLPAVTVTVGAARICTGVAM